MQLSITNFITDSPVRRAVERVEWFAREYNARSIYVMFSGGKDSVAALYAAMAAAKNVGFTPVAIFIALSGLTHPDNMFEAQIIWHSFCQQHGMKCHSETIVARQPGVVKWRVNPRPDNPTMYTIWSTHRRLHTDFWRAVALLGLPGPTERMGRGLRWCEPEMKGWVEEELPPNSNGRRPARLIIVGVRRSESWYRAARWPKEKPVTEYKVGDIVDIALSPIYDMSAEEVWSILHHAGVHKYVVRLYNKWGNVPNCMLCPLRSDKLNKRALKNIPTSMLIYIKNNIEKGARRFKPGTFVYEKSIKWISMINEELNRRALNSV